jgi:hypothetical protein
MMRLDCEFVNFFVVAVAVTTSCVCGDSPVTIARLIQRFNL